MQSDWSQRLIFGRFPQKYRFSVPELKTCWAKHQHFSTDPINRISCLHSIKFCYNRKLFLPLQCIVVAKQTNQPLALRYRTFSCISLSVTPVHSCGKMEIQKKGSKLPPEVVLRNHNCESTWAHDSVLRYEGKYEITWKFFKFAVFMPDDLWLMIYQNTYSIYSNCPRK